MCILTNGEDGFIAMATIDAQISQIFLSISFFVLRALVPLCSWWCTLDSNEPSHFSFHSITYLKKQAARAGIRKILPARPSGAKIARLWAHRRT
jgi:hypothetical protein